MNSNFKLTMNVSGIYDLVITSLLGEALTDNSYYDLSNGLESGKYNVCLKTQTIKKGTRPIYKFTAKESKSNIHIGMDDNRLITKMLNMYSHSEVLDYLLSYWCDDKDLLNIAQILNFFTPEDISLRYVIIYDEFELVFVEPTTARDEKVVSFVNDSIRTFNEGNEVLDIILNKFMDEKLLNEFAEWLEERLG